MDIKLKRNILCVAAAAAAVSTAGGAVQFVYACVCNVGIPMHPSVCPVCLLVPKYKISCASFGWLFHGFQGVQAHSSYRTLTRARARHR